MVWARVMMCGLLFGAFAVGRAEAGKGKAPKYPLLSPLVEQKDHHARLVHLLPLKAELLEKLAISDDTARVSIYVEDLNSGSWLGINERKPYELASLLKIGVAMAWMRWDQEQRGILEKYIEVTQKHVYPNDEFASVTDSPVKPGLHTVLSLIEKMLVNSDNTANNALVGNVPRDWLERTCADVGIPNPFDVEDTSAFNQGGQVSPKQYAYMLKALYNASYLDDVHSQMILRMLCRTRFNQGLRKVLPAGVPAALKYGFWGGVCLHESGIVYWNDNPYVVCIFTTLADTWQDVEINLRLIRDSGFTIHAFFDRMTRPHGR